MSFGILKVVSQNRFCREKNYIWKFGPWDELVIHMKFRRLWSARVIWEGGGSFGTAVKVLLNQLQSAEWEDVSKYLKNI